MGKVFFQNILLLIFFRLRTRHSSSLTYLIDVRGIQALQRISSTYFPDIFVFFLYSPIFFVFFRKISFQFKLRRKKTNTNWFKTACQFHHQPYLIIKTPKLTRINQEYFQVNLNNEMTKATHLLSEFSNTQIQERFYLQRCSSLNICTELTMSIAEHMMNSNFAIRNTIFLRKNQFSVRKKYDFAHLLYHFARDIFC